MNKTPYEQHAYKLMGRSDMKWGVLCENAQKSSGPSCLSCDFRWDEKIGPERTGPNITHCSHKDSVHAGKRMGEIGREYVCDLWEINED